MLRAYCNLLQLSPGPWFREYRHYSSIELLQYLRQRCSLPIQRLCRVNHQLAWCLGHISQYLQPWLKLWLIRRPMKHYLWLIEQQFEDRTFQYPSSQRQMILALIDKVGCFALSIRQILPHPEVLALFRFRKMDLSHQMECFHPCFSISIYKNLLLQCYISAEHSHH